MLSMIYMYLYYACTTDIVCMRRWERQSMNGPTPHTVSGGKGRRVCPGHYSKRSGTPTWCACHEGEWTILYVDRHLVHEVTSAQAFEGLRLSGRPVRRPEATFAVTDHNVPTTADRKSGVIANAASALQIATLQKNAAQFDLTLFDVNDRRQGIVHVIAPEQGITLPGMVIVCGDSHTSTHGALGALAFGIGTSEVEHVLATQTLLQIDPAPWRCASRATLPRGSTAKDLMLQIIGAIGTGGGARPCDRIYRLCHSRH